ncbi:MAG: DUF2695 domain-containing protein [Planctomycetes bacterium]|nr:DUF2695 domain-containing protein [Planctomycetota bacterium]
MSTDRREEALELFRQGTRLSESGKLEDGSRLLERAIELDPTFVPAYCNRALNHVLAGEMDEAAELYASAVDLAPGDPIPLAGLGAVAAERGEDDDAVRHLSRAIELGHPGPDVRSNLALVLDRRGERERAIALWREAHAIDPLDPTPISSLAEREDLSRDEDGRPFFLSRFQRYDLYRHLDGRLYGPGGGEPCGHDFRHSVGWALSRGLPTLPFLARLRESGAGCDCEVGTIHAESEDGAFEFARVRGLLAPAEPERFARALVRSGARLDAELPPGSEEGEDDPESWTTVVLPRAERFEIPLQPACGTRLFRLLDEAREDLGPGGWAAVVLASTTDLVPPAAWILEERRALELEVVWRAVGDLPGDELAPERIPPMHPATFHIQTLPAPWLPADLARDLSLRHGLVRSVSTAGEWALVGRRVEDEEPALASFLGDLSRLAPPGTGLSLRWIREGKVRLGTVEPGRVRLFRLIPAPVVPEALRSDRAEAVRVIESSLSD